MRNYAHIAKRYAEQVVSGDVLACELVQKTCRRHLDDLRRQKEKGYPYRFDDEAAARVCEFVELLPHVKGQWAARREQLILSDWQVFVTASVFGWLRKSDGRRRFRKSYVEVPRKNGKSAWSAGIGLYMLSADDEHGAEIYSGATSEKQAWETFRPAKLMAEKSPALCRTLGIEANASNISIAMNGSFFRPVIGKPGDGASPSFAIVDEYHEHASDDLVDTMLTGMGARTQPLLWVITTAGADIAGPCYAMHKDVVKMLDGVVPDDELFGIIYTIDPEDDWTSDIALQKANPNMGISVDAGFLRQQITEAVLKSRKQNVIKTKHLNVWVTSRQAFINMERWNALADPTLDEDDFIGEPCWMGLDLASKQDIAAVTKLFRREDDWYIFVRSYLPESRTQDPEKQHYQGWVIDGHLVTTEGDVIDYDRIEEDIAEAAKRYKVQALGYDPFNATQMALGLQKLGLNVVEVRMNAQQLSEPMKEIEALILSGKLHHDGNPCTSWQFSNVTARTDANDNVYPRKDNPESKIDGFVASVIAKRVSMVEVPDTSSVYNKRGIRVIG